MTPNDIEDLGNQTIVLYMRVYLKHLLLECKDPNELYDKFTKTLHEVSGWDLTQLAFHTAKMFPEFKTILEESIMSKKNSGLFDD